MISSYFEHFELQPVKMTMSGIRPEAQRESAPNRHVRGRHPDGGPRAVPGEVRPGVRRRQRGEQLYLHHGNPVDIAYTLTSDLNKH